LSRHGDRDRRAHGRGSTRAAAGGVDGGEMKFGTIEGRKDGRFVLMLMTSLLSVLPSFRLSAQDSSRISEVQSVLSPLTEAYGVSSAEGPVREAVRRLLPAWAQSETDTAGNLWVRVGRGDPVVVVIAHLDEIGSRGRAPPAARSTTAWAAPPCCSRFATSTARSCGIR